jgi:hypothetical protein
MGIRIGRTMKRDADSGNPSQPGFHRLSRALK